MNSKSYAVITGASSGIGEEFALRLAKEGFNIILIARRQDRLISLAEKIKSDTTDCFYITADLAKIEECVRVAEILKSRTIEVFINNAGFGDCGYFLETELHKDLNMIDVNVKALHTMTKLILKQMAPTGHGYILNVGSSAGLIPAGPYMATYYATKAYVVSLTRALARELKENKSPLYIGVLCPGPVDTEFNSVANVKFALKGISAKYCANYAIDKMKKRKVLIIPSLRMKLAMNLGRLLPQTLYIKMAGHQQKKKIYE